MTLRPNSAAIGGHQLGAAGRRIGADGVGIGRDRFEVGADLLDGRAVAEIGMLRAGERRVGNAGELAGEIRRRLLWSAAVAHKPACTHATSASTAATVRIE